MNLSWKAESEFVVTALVRAPVEEVRAFLSNPHAWIKLQPLVFGFRAEPGDDSLFHITEHFHFAGISIPHTYLARVVPHTDGVDSEAWSVPKIHVRNRMRWTAEETGTRLVETVRIEAPRPLLAFAARTANRAHETMLERIGKAVEVASSRGQAPR